MSKLISKRHLTTGLTIVLLAWAVAPAPWGLVTLLVAQAGGTVTEQYAEDGALTIPVNVSGSGPGAPAEQVVCGNGAWMRLRFAQLVLQGTDSLELVGSEAGYLRLQGNTWANRAWFTRAFASACVTVRPSFAQAGSQFAIMAHQSGTAPLASTPMMTVGAGDICDLTLECADTAAVITSMNPAPHVVYTLGDNQYESGLLAEYIRDYARFWGQFKGMTRPASGNHEYQSGNGGGGYFDYFNGIGQANGPAGSRGQGYYSYDLGEWHVVVLNTSNSGSVPYGAGSAQEQWLRRDLAANTKPCTMAQWHHPRFSRGNYFPGIASTQALWQALQDSRADIVLSGHDHNYQRFAPQTATGAANPDGMRLFVVGTGGRSNYAFRGNVANFQNGHDNIKGVLKLTLSSDHYAWQFLPAPGSPAFSDSGSLSCHNVPQLAVSVSPTSVTLQRGGTATATVTVSSGAGGSTTLSASGLPGGVTASFSPDSVTPVPGGSASSTVSLTASSSAATGSATVKLTATAGTTTASTTLAISIPDSNPPAAPAGLSATAGSGQVTLSWSPNTESDLGSYRVKRSMTSEGPYQSIASTSGTTYANTGLTNGTTYYYLVTAVDTSGNESGPSNQVQATPVDTAAPAAPTGLTASAGNQQISLDWINNGESDFANYRVKRSTVSGGPYNVIATVTTSAYTNTGLTNGVRYYYVVSAVDTAGNESPDSTSVSAVPTSESLLEQSTAAGDKVDVKSDLTGAQSFSRTVGGSYFITRLVLAVSRESQAPNGNLSLSIGTARNSGMLPGSAVAITPAQVTNGSGGTTFQTITLNFATPIGPLAPNTRYYLNFSTGASNGKAYYLQLSPSSVYPRGNYFKGLSTEPKDIHFQIWGTPNP